MNDDFRAAWRATPPEQAWLALGEVPQTAYRPTPGYSAEPVALDGQGLEQAPQRDPTEGRSFDQGLLRGSQRG
jgi:hypothetical protein